MRIPSSAVMFLLLAILFQSIVVTDTFSLFRLTAGRQSSFLPIRAHLAKAATAPSTGRGWSFGLGRRASFARLAAKAKDSGDPDEPPQERGPSKEGKAAKGKRSGRQAGKRPSEASEADPMPEYSLENLPADEGEGATDFSFPANSSSASFDELFSSLKAKGLLDNADYGYPDELDYDGASSRREVSLSPELTEATTISSLLRQVEQRVNTPPHIDWNATAASPSPPASSWPQLSEQDRVEAGFPRIYTGGLPLSTQPDNTSSWMRELETSGEQPNECRLLITSVVTFNQTNKEALHVVQKIYDYLRNATNHDKRIDYNIISVVQRPEGQRPPRNSIHRFSDHECEAILRRVVGARSAANTSPAQDKRRRGEAPPSGQPPHEPGAWKSHGGDARTATTRRAGRRASRGKGLQPSDAEADVVNSYHEEQPPLVRGPEEEVEEEGEEEGGRGGGFLEDRDVDVQDDDFVTTEEEDEEVDDDEEEEEDVDEEQAQERLDNQAILEALKELARVKAATLPAEAPTTFDPDTVEAFEDLEGMVHMWAEGYNTHHLVDGLAMKKTWGRLRPDILLANKTLQALAKQVLLALEEDSLGGAFLSPRMRNIRLRGGPPVVSMAYNTENPERTFSVVNDATLAE